MDYPKVCIILLNWNGLEDTVECLESLRSIAYPNYRVIVVDNCSSGDDAEILRDKFGDYIHVIENDRNHGFAEGSNIGMRYALENFQPDYLLLLNNDTVVTPQFLSALVDVAEGNERAGFVGPKLCRYDAPDVIDSAGGKVSLFTGRIRDIGWGHPSKDFENAVLTDYASGCALLVRREVAEEVGLMDPSYFLYCEEIEWQLRARTLGYVSLVDQSVEILHKGGATALRTKDIRYYYFTRNTLSLVLKHGSWVHLAVFVPFWTVYKSAQFLLNLARGEYTRCGYILRAHADLITGKRDRCS